MTDAAKNEQINRNTSREHSGGPRAAPQGSRLEVEQNSSVGEVSATLKRPSDGTDNERTIKRTRASSSTTQPTGSRPLPTSPHSGVSFSSGIDNSEENILRGSGAAPGDLDKQIVEASRSRTAPPLERAQGSPAGAASSAWHDEHSSTLEADTHPRSHGLRRRLQPGSIAAALKRSRAISSSPPTIVSQSDASTSHMGDSAPRGTFRLGSSVSVARVSRTKIADAIRRDLKAPTEVSAASRSDVGDARRHNEALHNVTLSDDPGRLPAGPSPGDRPLNKLVSSTQANRNSGSVAMSGVTSPEFVLFRDQASRNRALALVLSNDQSSYFSLLELKGREPERFAAVTDRYQINVTEIPALSSKNSFPKILFEHEGGEMRSAEAELEQSYERMVPLIRMWEGDFKKIWVRPLVDGIAEDRLPVRYVRLNSLVAHERQLVEASRKLRPPILGKQAMLQLGVDVRPFVKLPGVNTERAKILYKTLDIKSGMEHFCSSFPLLVWGHDPIFEEKDETGNVNLKRELTPYVPQGETSNIWHLVKVENGKRFYKELTVDQKNRLEKLSELDREYARSLGLDLKVPEHLSAEQRSKLGYDDRQSDLWREAGSWSDWLSWSELEAIGAGITNRLSNIVFSPQLPSRPQYDEFVVEEPTGQQENFRYDPRERGTRSS